MQDKDMKLIMESWRESLEENKELNEFFNLGQFLGSELVGGSQEDKLKEMLNVLAEHTDRMAKRIMFLDKRISELIREEPQSEVASDLGSNRDINQVLATIESKSRNLVDKVAKLQKKFRRYRR